MNKSISTTAEPPVALAPKNTLYYIHCIIGLLFMFGFGSLAPFEPITPVGMQVLGVFLGLIYLWSFVSTLWPSLLGLIALGLTEYSNMPAVLTAAFGDKVPILILFAMILFGAIQQAGVTKYISRWFLTRKIINGRPVMFSFVFFFCTYVLAALSANVLPALLLMWSILYSILQDVGYKKGDKYTSIMVIGTMFAAISGQASKPFTGSPLMIIGSFEKATNMNIDFLAYVTYGYIMSTVGIIAYALLIKFLFKPDMSKIADISTERFEKDKLPTMALKQKILFACLFGYMILILLPSILPKTIGFIAFLNLLGPWGVVIAFVIGLSMFKIDNQPIINFKEIVGRYVTWDVYLLVVMAIGISGALTAESTGISEFTKEVLNPLLGGRSQLAFAVIFLVFGMLITNVANNAVMAILLLPIMYTFALENGSNPAGLATLIIFSMHIALLTPAASPYAAILFGNKDWVEPGEIVKYGSVIVMTSLALFLLIGIPLSRMMF